MLTSSSSGRGPCAGVCIECSTPITVLGADGGGRAGQIWTTVQPHCIRLWWYVHSTLDGTQLIRSVAVYTISNCRASSLDQAVWFWSDWEI